MIKKYIVRGSISGKVLKSNKPINFLSSIDIKTGIVTDNTNILFQKSIKGVILIFPCASGSSVGAYSIYSLKSNNSFPVAMICKISDLIVASGCALANIPLAIISEKDYNTLHTGMILPNDVKNF